MISVVRLFLGTVLALGVLSAPVAAGSVETDEILRVLPADMAACIVIEDLSDHLDVITESSWFKQTCDHPLVQRWLASSNYVSFEQLLAFFPLYFGISNEKLIDDLLGESVVLSFRPGEDNEPPVGLVALRAANEETLSAVIERMTEPRPNREIRRHEHMGVSFYERTEFEGRVDFLLRLGPVVVLSDKRSAIESVIATSIQGSGLYDVPAFRQMRDTVGEGAAVQLLVNPRPFDRMLASAVDRLEGPQRYVAQSFVDLWHECEWACVSLRIDDHFELRLETSLDMESLSPGDRQWVDILQQTSMGWGKIPADSVFAAASKIVMSDIADRFLAIANLVPELGMLTSTFDELATGMDSGREIFTRLGPEFSFAARVDKEGKLRFWVDVEMTGGSELTSAGISIAKTIEIGLLRPILVFYSLDLRNQFQDSVRVETMATAKGLIHFMNHSTWLPDGLRPGFIVGDDHLTLLSAPEALDAVEGPTWNDSAEAKRFAERSEPGEQPKFFVSFRRLREYLGSHRTEIAGNIARGAEVSQDKADGRLAELASLLELVDFGVVSTSTNGSTRRWTLSIYPSR